ncbi:hypothetical protein GQ55_7G145400 [Panicum hallii var. hallii]|uniref:Uncharacterized protein n=1 Tax=Panicum hallii var. hallii TaxID=1504633 RepID=A0A2T7CV48_9POAL|nr:hypothetical protein GQ55_7G145400 [Panicum hallii var. hallii]
MFVHILTHVTFLDLDEKCISSRPRILGALNFGEAAARLQGSNWQVLSIWNEYQALFETLFLKCGWLFHS